MGVAPKMGSPKPNRYSRFRENICMIPTPTRPGALSRGGPTTLTYHRPVPINRMAMCALCFLWMDVDMYDKGRVSKKLKLSRKADISQPVSVDLGA